MAQKRWRANVHGGDSYYVTEHVVYPKNGSIEATDTMLIQFLVKMYFNHSKDGGIQAERNRFQALIDTVSGSWVDGIYGSKTREAVLLFEKAAAAPYKDGIVRPLCDGDKIFRNTLDYLSSTKLEKLNWNFIQAFPTTLSRRNQIEAASSKLLKRLHG